MNNNENQEIKLTAEDWVKCNVLILDEMTREGIVDNKCFASVMATLGTALRSVEVDGQEFIDEALNNRTVNKMMATIRQCQSEFENKPKCLKNINVRKLLAGIQATDDDFAELVVKMLVKKMNKE